MQAKKINVFIASASEVKAEREKAIVMLNHLNKSHAHLQLEAIGWEYDLSPGNQPNYASLQAAIDEKLLKSEILVFVFYSRIGQYTQHEFELAIKEHKKIFVFFKSGFSPLNKIQLDQYGDLLAFKESLDNTILHTAYNDVEAFYGVLYQQLDQYLHEAFPSPTDLNGLKKQLQEKEDKIKKLEEELKHNPSKDLSDKLKQTQADLNDINMKLQTLQQKEKSRTDNIAEIKKDLAAFPTATGIIVVAAKQIWKWLK